MKRLNNKGQSLVLFVLIIPILLLIMILVIDIGYVLYSKTEQDNINYMVVEYGLDNINNIDIKDKMTNLIVLNSKSLSSIEVNISNNKIFIYTKKNVNSMFLEKFKIYNLDSKYVGYIDNNKKIIERA